MVTASAAAVPLAGFDMTACLASMTEWITVARRTGRRAMVAAGDGL
jgi:hypothetical protein